MPERFEIIRSIKALYKSSFLSFPFLIQYWAYDTRASETGRSPPCDVEGYLRNMQHVRQPHAGLKFGRKSTTCRTTFED